MVNRVSLGFRSGDQESRSQGTPPGWDPLTPSAEKLVPTVSELFRFPPSDIRTHVAAAGLHSVVGKTLRSLGSPNRRVLRKGRKLALASLGVTASRDSEELYRQLTAIGFGREEATERRRTALWCLLTGIEYFVSNEFARALRDAMRSVSAVAGAVALSLTQQGGRK
jgi:hypothetical protein